jgi:serine/threonine protein phosphatase PrpC
MVCFFLEEFIFHKQYTTSGVTVSRALGDHFIKENISGMTAEPYVSEPIKLTEEDTLLIVASDGVRIHLFFLFSPSTVIRLTFQKKKMRAMFLFIKLWDVMSGQQAVDMAKAHANAMEMASSLLSTALADSRCTDNVTVIVVRL